MFVARLFAKSPMLLMRVLCGGRARVGGERATPARGNATHPPREAGILQLRTLLLGVVFPSLLVHGVRVFNVQGIVEFVDVVDVVVS